MKAKLIKIGVSIILLVAIVMIIRWINAPPSITSGTIHLVVIDEASTTIIDENIPFETTADDPVTLRSLLETHYQVLVEANMLIGIEGHLANNTTHFWKIWINCQMATRGIDAIYFEDGDEIRIVFTAIGDYGNNAC